MKLELRRSLPKSDFDEERSKRARIAVTPSLTKDPAAIKIDTTSLTIRASHVLSFIVLHTRRLLAKIFFAQGKGIGY